MTLCEYLNSIEDETMFDMIVNDEEIMGTVVWSSDLRPTEHFLKKHANILSCEIRLHKDKSGNYTDALEVLGDATATEGEDFVNVCIGMCSEEEYDASFVYC